MDTTSRFSSFLYRFVKGNLIVCWDFSWSSSDELESVVSTTHLSVGKKTLSKKKKKGKGLVGERCVSFFDFFVSCLLHFLFYNTIEKIQLSTCVSMYICRVRDYGMGSWLKTSGALVWLSSFV